MSQSLTIANIIVNICDIKMHTILQKHKMATNMFTNKMHIRAYAWEHLWKFVIIPGLLCDIYNIS